MSVAPAQPATTHADLGVDLARLPARLRALVRALGLARTVAFLERFGGTKLRLRDLHHSGRLTVSLNYRDVIDCLGQPGIEALLTVYPDQLEILLPMPDVILQQLRDEQIAAALAEGIPTRTIAMRFHLTQRWVQMIKRRIEGDRSRGSTQEQTTQRQRDLFYPEGA